MINFPNPEVFCRQNGKHEYKFWVFSNSEMHVKTVRAEKVDEKTGVIYLASMFPSWFMVLKLS